MSGGHVTSASACYSTCADMSSVQLNVNSLLHPYGDACKCVCVCVCTVLGHERRGSLPTSCSCCFYVI